MKKRLPQELKYSATQQRLLEHKILEPKSVIDIKKSLKQVNKPPDLFCVPTELPPCGADNTTPTASLSLPGSAGPARPFTVAAVKPVCYFCGYTLHPRFKCPDRNAVCNHFYNVCKYRNSEKIQHSLVHAYRLQHLPQFLGDHLALLLPCPLMGQISSLLWISRAWEVTYHLGLPDVSLIKLSTQEVKLLWLSPI